LKNKFLIICILIISITSCERDDICIDDTTPDFTIRFYDSEDPTEFKTISGLKVKLLDTEVDTLLFSSDSIQLPLRLDIDTTKYSVTNELSESDIKTDTITLTYTSENIFVGRACGFKSIFNEVSYQSTTNWITNFEIVTETIIDENAAHVKIFH
jgi:hypothetical protein